jgi:NAD(P)H-dependent FMN reductase
LKNALDFAREGWNNRAAEIVSYGSTGGARAAEHLRGIMGELMIADVRVHPTLSLFNVNEMLDQVIAWSGALKTLR